MILRLGSNRYITSNGTKAKVVFTFSGTGATVGQGITFTTAGGVAVTMTFAVSLDDSGTKLRTNTTGLTIAQFVEQVYNDFLTNWYLRDLYDITYNATSITFTAKEVGADYTTVSFCSATGISISTMTAGTDRTLADNYRMRVDIYAESEYEADDFAHVASVEGEPIPGYADFDSSELLRATFSEPDLPAYIETTVVKSTKMLKRYYLVYSERYGNPSVMKKAEQTDNLMAYFGGVSLPEYNINPLVLDHFNTEKRFLTWQETDKRQWTDSQDYLYFAVPGGVSQFRVVVSAVYTDGSSSTAYPWTRTSMNAGDIFRIPSGYANLAAVSGVFTSGRTVKYYTVAVDDNGGTPVTLADGFLYRMEYRERYEKHTFLFNNSLPAMETLITTGELVTGVSVEAFTAEQARVFSESVVDALTFRTYAEKLDVFKVSTGWQTKVRIDQVTDELLLADYVYIADPVRGKWVKVIINKASIEKFKTQQDMYAVNFEYTLAYTDQVIQGDIAPSYVGPLTVTIGSESHELVIDTLEPLEINIQ